MLDDGMLDRSPGALYPKNRGMCASRLVMPRFVGDMDAGDKENVLQLGGGAQARKPPPAPPSACDRERERERSEGRLEVLCSTMAHPNVMRQCGWRHVVRLRATSATLKSWIETGEDAWKTLSACLADEAGLYMPVEAPECASGKWKNYFFDHLFPARHKWDLESLRISDHKIRVAVRFKAGAQRDRQLLVLPLHQRLKMLKKGEKITAEEAAGDKGVSIEELKAQLVTMAGGGDLDADVLEMLQDAQNLQHAATRAETDANNLERRVFEKWDSEGAPGAGGDAADNTSTQAHAAGVGASGFGGGGGGGTSSESSRDTVQADDDTETQRRRSGRSRVLTVERSKVVAFVPGVGVRPFIFAHVFDKDAAQETAQFSNVFSTVTFLW